MSCVGYWQGSQHLAHATLKEGIHDFGHVGPWVTLPSLWVVSDISLETRHLQLPGTSALGDLVSGDPLRGHCEDGSKLIRFHEK